MESFRDPGARAQVLCRRCPSRTTNEITRRFPKVDGANVPWLAPVGCFSLPGETLAFLPSPLEAIREHHMMRVEAGDLFHVSDSDKRSRFQNHRLFTISNHFHTYFNQTFQTSHMTRVFSISP